MSKGNTSSILTSAPKPDTPMLNNVQLNVLVEKIFSRVLDLAQTRPLHLRHSDGYEFETVDLNAVSNVPDLDEFLSAYTEEDIKFNVLNHTCPVCLISFEQAKFVVRHFVHEHALTKPAYKCANCNEFMPIDDYLRHLLLLDGKHTSRFWGKNIYFKY